MANKAILWFINNLRLSDNVCLQFAATQKWQVLPIYILDERLEESAFPEIPRCGEKRKNWLFANVSSLKQDLQRLGTDLHVQKGNIVQTLNNIIKITGIKTIITCYEPGSEEESDIAELKQNSDVNLYVLYDNFLIHPDSLPFTLENLPKVFTDFRIKIEKNLKEEIFVSSDLPDFISLSEINSEVLNYNESSDFFKPGKSGAIARLNYYFFETGLVSTYKETRNQLLGNDFSSHFSPWLALGVISSQRIIKYLREYENRFGANESTYWLWFELLWRDFFRYQMMKYKNLFFLKNGLSRKQVNFKNDISLFKQWMNGKTAEPFVNANMKELNQTGFMSNRGRQNVASYLIHDLGIDWRWGARYFESQLLDYDVSSNWGNWAYIAGVGNDPRPFRKFNITKQQEQYDPNGTYINYWINR
ncbi:MAG: DASH family cryptochrome [Bacteroidia bacterium]